MKGDFSRITFDKSKHYSGVLKQQGRVDVDADWNEQQAINRHRIETEAADVIGCCGAPQRAPGFGITIDQGNIYISKGRIYVDGILCENPVENLDILLNQPDLPPRDQTSAPKGLKAMLKVASAAAQPHGLIFYLDVWQRHLTALDDDSIREKALGGPDTATRLKTIWQVKWLQFSIPTFTPAVFVNQINLLANAFNTIASNLAPEVKQKLSRIQKSSSKLMKAKAAPVEWNPTLLDAKNLLDAVAKLDLPANVKPVISEIINPMSLRLPPTEPSSCKNPPLEWGQLVAPSTAQLAARTQPDPATDDPCTIPPGAGYRGLENQLYRVEIHQGNVDQNGAKAATSPTFKWSRDNGSIVTAITGIDASTSTITVHDIGPDNLRGFAIGQWVEVIDDTRELYGQPGDLVQITQVEPDTKQIIVTGTMNLTFDGIRHPKLRRWDSAGEVDVAIDGTWQPLEAGIEVQFSPLAAGGYGTFRTGDYWLIPARTANSETTNDIEWPHSKDSNGDLSPTPQPPLGIKHHYCRLALVQTDKNAIAGGITLDDCRCIFPSLCNLQRNPAMNVVNIVGWKNDDWVDPRAFIKNGLKVELSSPPDSVCISNAIMIVTIEIPYQAQASLNAFQSVILGDVTISNQNVLVWQITQEGAKYLLRIASAVPQLRVRVTLKGSTIWSTQGGQPLYLDGQAFGVSGLWLGGTTPCVSLLLPSGAGLRASDFESWFYLGNPPPPPVQ